MKKKFALIIVLFFTLLFIDINTYSAGKTITLRLDANKNCLNEKREGEYLMTRLKPKTRYFVQMTGSAWLSYDTGHRADPVYGLMTYYRTFENGQSVDSYRVIRSGDRFVFTSAQDKPFFVGFIMEIYSQRNNHGTFVVTIRELGPAN